jgi:hypothetical protein
VQLVVYLQKVQPETKLPLDKPQNKKLPHKRLLHQYPHQRPHRKLRLLLKLRQRQKLRLHQKLLPLPLLPKWLQSP